MSTMTINGKTFDVTVEDNMPLLWFIRDVAGMSGTKFGCGKGLCGACTVHLDGQAVRSCITPIASARGKAVTTIEGISGNGQPHPLQRAWVEEQVPQCGYCQSGHIMTAAAFLKRNPDPTDEEIRNGVTNLCRCGTYLRIRAAIRRAARSMQEERT